MKFSRRHFLLAGVAAGISGKITNEYLDRKAEQERFKRLFPLLSQRDEEQILQETLEADAKKLQEMQEIQQAVKLLPPKISYSREMSKLLILCSKLATQQYLKGKIVPNYDGSIKSLPAYSSKLNGYRQVFSLVGLEERVSQEIALEVPEQVKSPQNTEKDLIEKNVEVAQKGISKTVKEVIEVNKTIPVYFGFVLSSKKHNILVFRGTQRTVEWLSNFTAIQILPTTFKGLEYYGEIHSGFATIYSNLAEQTREVIKSLDFSVPCYIAGHSLGAAVATLAAMDLALTVPKIKPQLQLYTYAGPRVGDPVFAKIHNRLIPNSYRVVNLADMVPLVPFTVFLKDKYVHVGQLWSFLSQNGDVMPNHVVDTYRLAIDGELEQLR